MRWKPFVPSLSIFLLLACLCAAQDIPAGGDASTKYKLEGVVINSDTGQPIPRAMVEIIGSDQAPVLTGNDGRFKFERLTAEELSINVTKPGYFELLDSGRFHVASSKEPRVFKLEPERVLVGHVRNTDGEPLEGVLVRVREPEFNGGRKSWRVIRQNVTDEDGGFRIGGLQTDTCYVSAEANQASQRTITDELQGVKQGYPGIVYYPAAADSASAQPVHLSSTQPAELQFTLPSRPVFRISGRVSGFDAEGGSSLHLLTRGGDEVSVPTRYVPQTGTFEMRFVPVGSYFLQVRTGNRQSPSTQEFPVEVVSKNLEHVELVLATPVSIPVLVRSQVSPDLNTNGDERRHTPQAARVQVALHRIYPLKGAPNAAFFTSDPSPQLLVSNVMPGRYQVAVFGENNVYVESARSGSVDLFRDPLMVAESGEVKPIEITVRDDGGAVDGTVRGGNPGFAALIIVPIFAPGQPPRYESISGTNQFHIDGLRPGSYRVFAFDWVNDLEYANPEVLARYESKAARVDVASRGKTEITLDLIHPEERQ